MSHLLDAAPPPLDALGAEPIGFEVQRTVSDLIARTHHDGMGDQLVALAWRRPGLAGQIMQALADRVRGSENEQLAKGLRRASRDLKAATKARDDLAVEVGRLRQALKDQARRTA